MTRAKEDIKQWETWKTNPTPENLSNLVSQMKPVIHKAIQVNQGALSPAVVEAEAKIQAVNAFKTYDPNRDTQLSTHVTNYMKKVNRLNYTYQDIYSVPEARRIKYSTFANTVSRMKEEKGRDPSADELATELGWSRAEVSRYLAENRRELSDNQPHHSDLGAHDTRQGMVMSYIYNDLTPTQKLLFENVTGYGGKKVMDGTDLRRAMNMTQGQLSYAKRQLTDIVKKAAGRFR